MRGELGDNATAMDALESAVKEVLDLLASDQYEAVEKLTHRRRLNADQIESAISSYGRRAVAPGDGWWGLVEVTPIDVGDAPAFHVAAPLWTQEEGRSDLTIEMRLIESGSGLYDVEILNIHVL